MDRLKKSRAPLFVSSKATSGRVNQRWEQSRERL